MKSCKTAHQRKTFHSDRNINFLQHNTKHDTTGVMKEKHHYKLLDELNSLKLSSSDKMLFGCPSLRKNNIFMRFKKSKNYSAMQFIHVVDLIMIETKMPYVEKSV